jgi:YrbI family 3-deoxy-D-manno-octulosonate 8-phosphate phosphatase
MVEKAKVLAIIPARGGSKGIPRKNIKDFAGYPLIAYSIAAGIRAKSVDRVIVSTDDEEIAEVSRSYGAEVPFLRPSELAQDNSTDMPVIVHVLERLKKDGKYEPGVVVQLRPTTPIRPMSCVDDAVDILLSHPKADCVRGVVPSGQNPFKMWKIKPGENNLTPLLSLEGIVEPYNAPRQVLPQTYWQTGHIDAIRSSCIHEKRSLTGDTLLPLMIDPRFTVDIDNPFDWLKAEWLVWHGGLEMVDPATQRRPLPRNPTLLVMDFDGVLTDNRVWVDEAGHERIAASRADSMGLLILRQQTSIEGLVISSETNPVVSARCKKLNLSVLQGINDKATTLKNLIKDRRILPEEVIYVGNDVNDLPCFPMVGCAVSPADAEPMVRRKADLILKKNGGHGAIRELCDLILSQKL